MIEWTHFVTGSHRTACPNCTRNDREKTLGLTINPDGSGVAHCFRCGIVETARKGLHLYKPVQPSPRVTKHERLSKYGFSIWNDCKPVSGVAEAYLNVRQCVIPPEDGHLRWHPALKHPSGYVGAAMVALVTDTLTGEPLTLHRTWITPIGKENVDPPRMLLGNHTSKGGVIRLWSDDFVTTGLAVAEGIETALSLAWGFTPVWATIDAGHLKRLPVIQSVQSLTIAVDQDEAGQDAAYHCAARWLSAGCSVQLTQQKANDLNDVLLGAA